MALHFRDAEALAARAWDVTKDDDEPAFAASSSEHRSKLVNIVEDIVDKGVGSGIQGLERFEAYVRGVMPVGTNFAGLAVAQPSAEFAAAAAKRREEFSAKEAELLAKELDRVDAENRKKAAAEAAEDDKADAKVAKAIAADRPKPAGVAHVSPAPRTSDPVQRPAAPQSITSSAPADRPATVPATAPASSVVPAAPTHEPRKPF